MTIPNHASGVGRELISVSKIASAKIEKLSASIIFFARPLINLNEPLTDWLILMILWDKYLAISWYLIIGPAISCGKNEMYSPTLIGFISACSAFRYTSMI